MAKRRHTSARGDQVDFDLLQHQNKEVVAIGNAKMNANGDILGAGGKIVRRVEDIPVENIADPTAAYNETNPKSTKMVSLKSKVDELPEVTLSVPEEEASQVDDSENAKEETTNPSKSSEKPKNKRKIVDSEE